MIALLLAAALSGDPAPEWEIMGNVEIQQRNGCTYIKDPSYKDPSDKEPKVGIVICGTNWQALSESTQEANYLSAVREHQRNMKQIEAIQLTLKHIRSTLTKTSRTGAPAHD